MPPQRLAPDAVLVQSNLTGALSTIQDDPDVPDMNWMEATSDSTATDLRVGFPTPGGATGYKLEPGGQQEFRALVRKSSALGNDGSAGIELWQGGALVKTLVAATTVSSITGVVLNGWFTDADVTDKTGAAVECRVVGTVSGGSPSARRVIDVGALEWNALYVSDIKTVSAAVAVAGGGNAQLVGTRRADGEVVTPGGGSPLLVVLRASRADVTLAGGGAPLISASRSTSGVVLVAGGGAPEVIHTASTGPAAVSVQIVVGGGGTAAGGPLVGGLLRLPVRAHKVAFMPSRLS